MRRLDGAVRLLEVSAARRVLIDHDNGKFNPCISSCPFNGWCLLFRLSAYACLTVFYFDFSTPDRGCDSTRGGRLSLWDVLAYIPGLHLGGLCPPWTSGS